MKDGTGLAPPTALLMGRKGSKGLPGKNTMLILGRKVMHYPLMAAQNSIHVEHIFTSTDDEEIAEESKKNGSQLITRPPELCTDTALFEDALRHGYFEIKKQLGKPPEFLVALMCNACTVNASLIDQAIEMFRANSEADSAVTVSIYNMWSPLRARKLNEEGFLMPFVDFEYFGDPATLNCDRDSQGDVYFADMSHSVCRSKCLEDIDNGLLPQKWMGKNILPVPNQYGCDIDEPWQIDMSIRWLKEYGFEEGKK